MSTLRIDEIWLVDPAGVDDEKGVKERKSIASDRNRNRVAQRLPTTGGGKAISKASTRGSFSGMRAIRTVARVPYQ